MAQIEAYRALLERRVVRLGPLPGTAVCGARTSLNAGWAHAIVCWDRGLPHAAGAPRIEPLTSAA